MRGIMKLSLLFISVLSLLGCKPSTKPKGIKEYSDGVEIQEFKGFSEILNSYIEDKRELSYSYREVSNESIKTEVLLKSRTINSTTEATNSYSDCKVDYDNQLIEASMNMESKVASSGSLGKSHHNEAMSDSSFYQHHGEGYYLIDKQTNVAKLTSSFSEINNSYLNKMAIAISYKPDIHYYIDDNTYTLVEDFSDAVGKVIKQITLDDDEFIYYEAINKEVSLDDDIERTIITINSTSEIHISFKDINLKMYDMRKFKMI